MYESVVEQEARITGLRIDLLLLKINKVSKRALVLQENGKRDSAADMELFTLHEEMNALRTEVLPLLKEMYLSTEGDVRHRCKTMGLVEQVMMFSRNNYYLRPDMW